MTNEERDLITRFIQRVGGAPAAGFAASVPASGSPPLPPIDREADALIADMFTRYPEARYRITQTAFVQEHALAEAQNQINRLQWELQNLRQQQAAQPQPEPQQPSPWGAAAQQPPQQSRGILGGLFGSRPAAPPQPPPQYQQPQYQQPQYAPPPPQFAPGYQPGMFQRSGSGFLGSALGTAAGVAGGVVAGQALMNLFSGGHQGFGGPSTVTEYVPVAPVESPWATQPPLASPTSDPYETGGAPKEPAPGSGNQDSGWQQPTSDNTDWQGGPPGDTGWQDAGTDDSGWTDAGSDSFDDNT
jgi:hypothetical protein